MADAPDTQRVVRSSLSSQVAEIIREQILTGTLRPGEKVVQAEWATRLGVSRMPVRDAIVSLATEGLLRQTARGTAEVAVVDVEDFADVFELNAAVGALAARRAASRRNAEELAALERLQGELAAASERGDLGAASDLNWELHRVINRAARSPRLAALLKILSKSTPRHSFELLPGWAERAVEDHSRLIAAIRAGDAELAHDLMREHITRATQPLLDELRERFAQPG
jgi:DNA-binding GntR family transcriptional regulator